MKKLFSLSLLAAWLLSGGVAFASVGIQEDGSMEGQAANLNFSTDLDVSNDGLTATVTLESAINPTTITNTGDSNLGDTAGTSTTSGDKTTIVGLLYLPYYAKSAKPASGLAVGAIILQKGLSASDCGHGTTGNSTTMVVCASDGTNWVAV